MTYLLINAVKELHDENQRLKSCNHILDSDLQAMKEEIENMKVMLKNSVKLSSGGCNSIEDRR